jgi:hypothetical protein
MLGHARKKAAFRGIANIDFLQGGFLTYQHKGAPLDAIINQLALHHLPDFWKQVAQIRYGIVDLAQSYSSIGSYSAIVLSQSLDQIVRRLRPVALLEEFQGLLPEGIIIGLENLYKSIRPARLSLLRLLVFLSPSCRRLQAFVSKVLATIRAGAEIYQVLAF